jgi:WD40 repeat protein
MNSHYFISLGIPYIEPIYQIQKYTTAFPNSNHSIPVDCIYDAHGNIIEQRKPFLKEKLIYDESNRIIQTILYEIESGDISQTTDYIYDNHGRISNKRITSGEQIQKVQFTFNTDDTIENQHTEFNDEHKTYTDTYYYYENGQLKTSFQYYIGNKYSISISNYYYQQGLLILIYTKSFFQNDSYTSYQYIRTTDHCIINEGFQDSQKVYDQILSQRKENGKVPESKFKNLNHSNFQLCEEKIHNDFIGGLVIIDAQRYATSSEDGRIFLNKINSLLPILELDESAHSYNPVNYLCITPDSRYLFSAGDDCNINMWSLYDYKVKHVFKGHENYVSKIACTTDTLVSVSKDGTVRVWCLKSLQEKYVLEGHNDWVFSLAISTDGKKAITGSTNTSMIVWDIENGKIIKQLVGQAFTKFLPADENVPNMDNLFIGGKNTSGIGHEDYPCSMIWTDEYIISAAKDIIFWNTETFEEMFRLSGHEDSIYGLAITKDKKHFISVAKSIKVWNIKKQALVNEVLAHNGAEIKNIVLTKDNKLALTTDENGYVKKWNLKDLLKKKIVTGHVGYVKALTVTDDESIAITGGSDNNIIFWNAKDGSIIKKIKSLKVDFEELILTEDQKNLVVSGSKGLNLLGLENHKILQSYTYKKSLFNSGGFIMGDNFWISSYLYNLSRWNFSENNFETSEYGYSFSPRFVFNSDKSCILTPVQGSSIYLNETDDNGLEKQEYLGHKPIILFDIKQQKILHTFFYPGKSDNRVSSYEESKNLETSHCNYCDWMENDSKIIACFQDGTICIWNIESKELIKQFQLNIKKIRNVFFTTKYILVIEERTCWISFWDYQGNYITHIDIADGFLCIAELNQMKDKLYCYTDQNLLAVVNLTTKQVESRTYIPESNYMVLKERAVYFSGKDGFLYGFIL